MGLYRGAQLECTAAVVARGLSPCACCWGPLLVVQCRMLSQQLKIEHLADAEQPQHALRQLHVCSAAERAASFGASVTGSVDRRVTGVGGGRVHERRVLHRGSHGPRHAHGVTRRRTMASGFAAVCGLQADDAAQGRRDADAAAPIRACGTRDANSPLPCAAQPSGGIEPAGWRTGWHEGNDMLHGVAAPRTLAVDSDLTDLCSAATSAARQPQAARRHSHGDRCTGNLCSDV